MLLTQAGRTTLRQLRSERQTYAADIIADLDADDASRLADLLGVVQRSAALLRTKTSNATTMDILSIPRSRSSGQSDSDHDGSQPGHSRTTRLWFQPA